MRLMPKAGVMCVRAGKNNLRFDIDNMAKRKNE